jgi:UDP-N-acetylglucosamine--N-acetylmuramyl-(pentapeptide) pyrophosphoryl-undecaprenol N-acetylglucosamine transferase
MRILFSGGGTLGPVTPLLAIKDTIVTAYPNAEFAWVGTNGGPEADIIAMHHIPFSTISSGKLRRYLSVLNIIDICKICKGFIDSCRIMIQHDPDICITAGGYVSVPIHAAAWLFGVKTWVHQQDVVPGLANKIMARTATVVTTALEASVVYFPKKKTSWIGNPVRKEILQGNFETAVQRFSLDREVPVVFATGGGTGSMRVNQLITEAVQHLRGFAQVIHLSGKERPQELVERAVKHFDYYQVHQFFTEEMPDAYAAADIVVSRGGFGTITEIAALGKVAIFIPKPGHQVDNVKFLTDAGAAILVNEDIADGNYLAKVIRQLLDDEEKMERMGKKLCEMLPITNDSTIREVVKKLIG